MDFNTNIYETCANYEANGSLSKAKLPGIKNPGIYSLFWHIQNTI